MSNVNEIYNAATAIVVTLMRNDNIDQQVQQVIANNIDASVNQQTANGWIQIILQKLQNHGVNWQNGVQQNVLTQVCIEWLRAAIPEAVQIIQSRQGGGLIGGGGGGLIGGSKPGFDYSAITGSAGGAASGVVGGGSSSIYDTASSIVGGQPQQPQEQAPDVTITAQTQPQSQQTTKTSSSNGLKVVSGEYTDNMTLMGSPNSLLRSGYLDWLDAFDSVSFNTDPFGTDGPKSLGRAGFSAGLTGIRRARSSGDNQQSDTCYRLDVVASRPYDTPVEVLMDFYNSCPNEILKTLWYAEIAYDQFLTFDLPLRSYRVIRQIFSQFFPHDGDFQQKMDVWDGFYKAFGNIPVNSSGPIIDYLITRFGSQVKRFNRSVISPTTSITVDTMKDIETLVSPVLITRIREDTNWDATIAAGLADVAEPFISRTAPVDDETNTALIPYSKNYRANLGNAPLMQLLVEGDETKVKEAISAAAEYKTLVKIRRNIVVTNLLPSGHLTRIPGDYGPRSDQEDAFWKTFEFTNPSPSMIRRNEFVFAVPCTATPEDAIYPYEFSSLMGNATQPSLITSNRNVSGMILKGRIDY